MRQRFFSVAVAAVVAVVVAVASAFFANAFSLSCNVINAILTHIL